MDRAARCPSCSTGGKPVDRITLKALLTPDGLRRGIPAEPFYCSTANCPVVYFAHDGTTAFEESDVVVRVYDKHAEEGDTPVCYCFAVTVGAMCERESAHLLRSAVAREVKAGHCACEVKNPKGDCCLGDLVRVERAAAEQTASSSCCTTK